MCMITVSQHVQTFFLVILLIVDKNHIFLFWFSLSWLTFAFLVFTQVLVIVGILVPWEGKVTDWLFQNKVNNVSVSAGSSSEDVKKIRSVSSDSVVQCLCNHNNNV